jgi:hypothetical protein
MAGTPFGALGPEAASVIQELALRLVVWYEAVGRLRVDQIVLSAVKRPRLFFHASFGESSDAQ